MEERNRIYGGLICCCICALLIIMQIYNNRPTHLISQYLKTNYGYDATCIILEETGEQKYRLLYPSPPCDEETHKILEDWEIISQPGGVYAYAIPTALKKVRVTVSFDFSEHNYKMMSEDAEACGVTLEEYIRNNVIPIFQY